MGGSSAAKGTAAALKAFAAAVKLAEEEGLKNCNIPQILKIGQPYANLGNYTFHQIITIIAGIATILTCIIACTVAIGHLVYYVKPHEQKQLLRVIFTLPVFALFSLFGCWFYQAAPYLQPLPQIWEAFGIVAIFYFYVNCVTPKKDIREAFYDGLERQKSFQKTVKHENGSLRWFHLIWICVFQVCLGRIGTTIAYEYLEATLCPLDPRLARRTTAITIVQSVQTLIAVVAVVVYERRMKPHLRGYRPVAKLLSFKVILILEAFQSTIFKILRSSGVFTPTYHISVYDFSVGIPAFILCVEIMLFAVFFWWSFSFSPYRKLAADGYKTLGIFRGMWDCVYIMDIVYGILYLFKALVPGTFGRKYVQRTEDSAERQGTKSHVTPIHSGSESEPDSLKRSSAPVRATEKV